MYHYKPSSVSATLFQTLKSGKLTEFVENCDSKNLQPFLPCLLRMTLLPTPFSQIDQNDLRAKLLTCDKANFLVSCMRCDFASLETDLRKELKIRKKNLNLGTKFDAMNNSGFENGSADEKLRILLTELLTVNLLLTDGRSFNGLKKFEPLDNSLMFDDCCFLLCVACAEMKNFMEIENICEVLLRYKYGPYVIQRLACNFGDSYRQLFGTILKNGESNEDDSFVCRKRAESLELLCELNLSSAYELISACSSKNVLENIHTENRLRQLRYMSAYSKCHVSIPTRAYLLFKNFVEFTDYEGKVSLRKLPCTFVRFSLKYVDVNDFVSILCGILTGTDVQQRIWFVHFVQNGIRERPNQTNAAALAALKDRLMKEICLFVRNDVQLSNSLHHCTNLLKLICALRNLTGLKFNDEESKLIFDFVFTLPDPSVMATKFVLVGLSYLTAFPPSSSSSNNDFDTTVVSWLRRLIELEPDFLQCGESYGEMLLLMAINFHSNQMPAISQMISNVLRMKIQLKSSQLVKLKAIFAQDLFPEQVVAERASKIPVTKSLNASCQGYLPIHCVQQLLTSRTFTKHKICIKDWIIAQLAECKAPLHPAVPNLLEAYCNSCVIPLTKGQQNQASSANAPISETEILNHFGKDVFDENLIAFRILLMYYALLYEELVMLNVRNIAAVGRSIQSLENVFDSIPIFYLFTYVENHLNDYQTIYGPLMRLVTTQFPYLFSSSYVRKPLKIVDDRRIKLISPEEFSIAVKSWRERPVRALKILKRLVNVAGPGERLTDFIDAFCSTLPDLLDVDVPLDVVHSASALWTIYESLLPRKLYVATVLSLLAKQSGFRRLSHNDICDDPLLVLRVDERLFRCATFLKLLLRILQCYLTASRIRLQKQLHMAIASTAIAVRRANLPPQMQSSSTSPVQPPSPAEAEREELMRALIGAQESAAVQILLETCLPTINGNKESSEKIVQEVRSVVCSHLHQMFIADPMLSKLVHFQGYPRELIPIVVKGIPSVHICLDFIPEMFMQPDHEKRVFAIELLSYLCEQYSIPKACSCAKLAINVLSTLVSVLPGSEIVAIFDPVVSALVRISRHFPPLTADVISILVQVGRICSARLSAKGLSAYSICTPSYSSPWSKWELEQQSQLDRLMPERKLLNSLHKAFAFDIQESVLNCKL